MNAAVGFLSLLGALAFAYVVAQAQPYPQNSQALVYQAFTPTGYATLSAAASTGNVALGSTGAANTPFVALVFNTGAAAVNVALGPTNAVTVTASSGSYIPAGKCRALNALGAGFIAGILNTGSTPSALVIETGTGGGCPQ